MNRFKMHAVNCAMLGAFVCAMPKRPGERIPAADLPLGANRKERSASSCSMRKADRFPFLTRNFLLKGNRPNFLKQNRHFLPEPCKKHRCKISERNQHKQRGNSPLGGNHQLYYG